MSGEEITSSNDDASFAKANRKQLLAATGTNIEAATKQGSGQQAYSTDTSSSKLKGLYYAVDDTSNVWIRKADQLFHRGTFGLHQPFSTTFSQNVTGLFTIASTQGSLTLDSLDTTEGRAIRYTTGSSAGNQSGFNVGYLNTVRQFCPCMRIKFECNETSNNRFFAGWTSSISLVANSDSPLTGLSGVGLGITTTQTTYRILYNDGVTGQQSADTGVTIDTNPHTVDIYADNNGSRFFWSIDGGAGSGFLTTPIPAATTNLSFQVIYTNTTGGATRSVSLYQVWVSSDH